QHQAKFNYFNHLNQCKQQKFIMIYHIININLCNSYFKFDYCSNYKKHHILRQHKGSDQAH
ncbi:MAG: hypothetical protein ACKPKO_07870, partial [Candidatus Fonsibacter sp.]